MEKTTSEKLVELLINPFFLSDVLKVILYSSNRELTIFEVYLILPLLLKRQSREIFYSTNIKGTLAKLFENKEYLLINYNKEIIYNKELINKTLIILLSDSNIKYDSKTSKLIIENKSINIKLNKNYKKIAQNIGKVFSKYDETYIIKFMGVTDL